MTDKDCGCNNYPYTNMPRYMECQTVEKQIHTLYCELCGIANDLNLLAERVTIKDADLDKRVTQNTSDIANLKTQIASVQGQIVQVQADMVTLRSDYTTFETKVNTSLKTFQDNITNLSKAVTDLTTSYQALDNRVAVLEKSVDLDKLNEIIKSYQQILDQTKAMTYASIDDRTYNFPAPPPNQIPADSKLLVKAYTAWQVFAQKGDIDTVATAVQNVDARVSQEIVDRIAADKALQDQIDTNNTTLTNTLDKEAQLRQEGDDALEIQLTTLAQDTDQSFQDVTKQLSDAALDRRRIETESISRDSGLSTRIDLETSERKAADQNLQDNIDNLTQQTQDAVVEIDKLIKNEADARVIGDHNEANDRKAGDDQLQANLNQTQAALQKEIDDIVEKDKQQDTTINNAVTTANQANDRSAKNEADINGLATNLQTFKDTQDQTNSDVADYITNFTLVDAQLEAIVNVPKYAIIDKKIWDDLRSTPKFIKIDFGDMWVILSSDAKQQVDLDIYVPSDAKLPNEPAIVFNSNDFTDRITGGYSSADKAYIYSIHANFKADNMSRTHVKLLAKVGENPILRTATISIDGCIADSTGSPMDIKGNVVMVGYQPDLNAADFFKPLEIPVTPKG